MQIVFHFTKSFSLFFLNMKFNIHFSLLFVYFFLNSQRNKLSCFGNKVSRQLAALNYGHSLFGASWILMSARTPRGPLARLPNWMTHTSKSICKCSCCGFSLLQTDTLSTIRKHSQKA